MLMLRSSFYKAIKHMQNQPIELNLEPTDGNVQLSIAVSLKRLADMLEKLAPHIVRAATPIRNSPAEAVTNGYRSASSQLERWPRP
jgi:hypothetical protein